MAVVTTRHRRRARRARRARARGRPAAAAARGGSGPRRGRSCCAIAIVLGVWQIVVWSGWKPEYVAARRRSRCSTRSVDNLATSSATATPITLQRGVSSASRSRVVIGTVVGIAGRAQSASLRAGGRLDDHRAADDAVDRVVPARDRAVPARARARSCSSSCSARRRRSPTASSPASTTCRRSCCAPAACSARSGWTSFRHVVLPAALPSFVGGLKQGWAFAWRSLMAGELIVQHRRQALARPAARRNAADNADYAGVYAAMIVILIIGIARRHARVRHARARDPPPLRPDRRRGPRSHRVTS